MHSMNGNTAQQRAKWETTIDQRGVQLLHPDELALPGDLAMEVLRADQVANTAQGIAFVNSLWLEPKLRVQGGGYLCLILPGTLGSDLKRILSEIGPDMLGKCFETTLTLEDPVAKRQFVRNVVGVNLGLQHVKAASLPASVLAPTDDSVVAVVHAYRRHNVEGWDAIWSERITDTKRNVQDRITTLLGRTTFDLWSFKCTDAKLSALIRISPAELNKLLNSKDLLLFFRPFVPAGQVPRAEANVVLLWATKIQTTIELATVGNTLKGVLGFIATESSIGVRVQKDCLGPARAVLVRNNTSYCSTNRCIAGELRWIAHGFPSHWSAKAIVEVFSKPADSGE